jgi:hypothetical protein
VERAEERAEEQERLTPEERKAYYVERAIAHVLIPVGVGIGQELAWLRKFDSGIAS